MDAARYAPTASNRQDLGWIVVQDRAALRRLADSIAAWAEGSPLYAAVAEEYRRGVDTMLRDAPCALLVHSRRDFAMSGQDCGVALTYVELLLAAEGLGACWSGLAGRAALERPDLWPGWACPTIGPCTAVSWSVIHVTVIGVLPPVWPPGWSGCKGNAHGESLSGFPTREHGMDTRREHDFFGDESGDTGGRVLRYSDLPGVG